MQVGYTSQHLFVLDHPAHADSEHDCRLLQQTEAAGPYPDAAQRPCTSFLWVGEKHRLNREEIEELVLHLQAWLATGKFLDDRLYPIDTETFRSVVRQAVLSERHACVQALREFRFEPDDHQKDDPLVTVRLKSALEVAIARIENRPTP